jgi:putative ATP-dependent endonuclease of the OLD family
LTTHSNVAIDFFANDNVSQIVHVTHDRQQAKVRSVTTYVDNRGILDDLDVRASDLLQSNGVVWLEGPSDRLYFNRWMELYTDGEIREGAHYQCVFYGGRLLAHLSADDPLVDEDEVVKIFRVNRNALIIMDSDRRKAGQHLNGTKRRIIREVEDVGDMAWVTAGKEVENYIPGDALRSLCSNDDLPPLKRYADLKEYLNGIESDEGERFVRNKVLFAEKVLPHITKDNLAEVLDLEDKISKAYRRILEWNGVTPVSRS